MKQETKEIILKTTIIICAVWGIITCIAGVLCECNEKGPNKDYYSNLALIIFGIWVLFCIILCIMMCNIKLSMPKSSAEKVELISPDFESFKGLLEEKLFARKYEKKSVVEGNGFKMILYYTSNLIKTNIFALIECEEFTREIWSDSSDAVWDFISNSDEQIALDIFLIHCACVKRITQGFNQYVNANIVNEKGRYFLPVGVSFGGRKAYIAVQKGGFFKSMYKRLRAQFYDLIENQIEISNESNLEENKK